MMISGMSPSGGIQDKVSSADLRSIESRIQKLRQQLEKVKGDDQIPPEEREKRIRKLEEQIKRLEEQKRKLEQKEQNKASDPEGHGAQSPSDLPADENLGNYVDTWG